MSNPGDVFPNRNLGPAEKWGRTVEERLEDLESALPGGSNSAQVSALTKFVADGWTAQTEVNPGDFEGTITWATYPPSSDVDSNDPDDPEIMPEPDLEDETPEDPPVLELREVSTYEVPEAFFVLGIQTYLGTHYILSYDPSAGYLLRTYDPDADEWGEAWDLPDPYPVTLKIYEGIVYVLFSTGGVASFNLAGEQLGFLPPTGNSGSRALHVDETGVWYGASDGTNTFVPCLTHVDLEPTGEVFDPSGSSVILALTRFNGTLYALYHRSVASSDTILLQGYGGSPRILRTGHSSAVMDADDTALYVAFSGTRLEAFDPDFNTLTYTTLSPATSVVTVVDSNELYAPGGDSVRRFRLTYEAAPSDPDPMPAPDPVPAETVVDPQPVYSSWLVVDEEGNVDSEWQYVDGLWEPRPSGGNRIAVGAITETKIADDSITTPKIVANAIVGDKIAANTIGADKILTETLGADEGFINVLNSSTINLTGQITAGSDDYEVSMSPLGLVLASRASLTSPTTYTYPTSDLGGRSRGLAPVPGGLFAVMLDTDNGQGAIGTSWIDIRAASNNALMRTINPPAGYRFARLYAQPNSNNIFCMVVDSTTHAWGVVRFNTLTGAQVGSVIPLTSPPQSVSMTSFAVSDNFFYTGRFHIPDPVDWTQSYVTFQKWDFSGNLVEDWEAPDLIAGLSFEFSPLSELAMAATDDTIYLSTFPSKKIHQYTDSGAHVREFYRGSSVFALGLWNDSLVIADKDRLVTGTPLSADAPSWSWYLPYEESWGLELAITDNDLLLVSNRTLENPPPTRVDMFSVVGLTDVRARLDTQLGRLTAVGADFSGTTSMDRLDVARVMPPPGGDLLISEHTTFGFNIFSTESELVSDFDMGSARPGAIAATTSPYPTAWIKTSGGWKPIVPEGEQITAPYQSLDDYTTPGVYYWTTGSPGASWEGLNYPENARGTLEVIGARKGTTVLTQVYTTTGTTSTPGNRYWRTRNTSSSGWSPWVSLSKPERTVTSDNPFSSMGSNFQYLSSDVIVQNGWLDAIITVRLTGASITVPASGNFADVHIGSIRSEYRNAMGRDYDMILTRTGVLSAFARLAPSGAVDLTHGLPGTTIATGQDFRFKLSHFVNF